MTGKRRSIPVVLAALLTLPLLAASPVEEEYARRAEALRRLQSEELLSLAGWCRQNKLNEQARRLLERVLILDPGHQEARAQLAGVSAGALQKDLVDVQVTLVDDTHLIARTWLGEVSLLSPYGELRFDPASIDLIAFHFLPPSHPSGPDLVMAERLVMAGTVTLGSIEVVTKVGSFTITQDRIKSLRVVRQCSNCQGKTAITCPTCLGAGKIETREPCPTCHGVDSKVQCQKCGGKGELRCDACGGSGRQGIRRCGKCKGDGVLKCKDCAGAGWIICKECQGAGSKVEVKDCHDCTGAGSITCPVCGGKGVRPALEPVWPVPPQGPRSATTAPAQSAPPREGKPEGNP